jgi:hypothetical protein
MKPTPIKHDAYFIRSKDKDNFYIHYDPSMETRDNVGYRVMEGYIGAAVFQKHKALNFIKFARANNLEAVRVNDVLSNVKDVVDKTVVIQYEEAMNMIDYLWMSCGCCKNDEFDVWFEKNEAYFIKRGMFIIEGLMKDQNDKFIKYCFTFNFEDPSQAVFVIYNYYNQQEVCSFRYIRKEGSNPRDETEIVFDYYDRKLFDSLGGDFTNEETGKKVDKLWEDAEKSLARIKKDKERKNYLDKIDSIGRKMEHETMCGHTVLLCYAAMYYFSESRNIEFKEYDDAEEISSGETEVKFKNVTRKYYYTGYVNLNKVKVCRINTEEMNKEKEKREFQRHVEKWSVRGHYRTLKNGKKIWIEAHEKGQGNLEKRVYGDTDEKDVNIIPKVFEVTKSVPIVVDEVAVSEIQKEKRKETFVNDWIVTPEEHPAPDFMPEQPEQKKPNLTKNQNFSSDQ